MYEEVPCPCTRIENAVWVVYSTTGGNEEYPQAICASKEAAQKMMDHLKPLVPDTYGLFYIQEDLFK